MPPKRKRDDTGLDDRRQVFRKRGDMPLYLSGMDSDCVVVVGEDRISLHKPFLISRSGTFKKHLTQKDKLYVGHRGRTSIEVTTHDINSVRYVVEFIYGDWKLEIMEHPSENQPIIQDCILLYTLGHDFDIPKLIAYAIKHLGIYLSRKLKEICLYPVQKAIEAAAPREFMEDLEAGIGKAEQAPPGATELARRNHPRRMLMDFVVVGRDVLLADAGFRLSISQDDLPAAFIRDAFLAQNAREYQSRWMTNLMVRPEKLTKPEPKKRGHCAGCGEGVSKDQTVVFNPWSHQSLNQKFTQFCCEGCAKGMDEGDGSGVQWDVFDDVKEE